MGVMQVKRLADTLTASRAVISLIIVLLGFAGKRVLATVVLLTIIGWTTDVLDGRLARRDKSGRTTWIGDHDFPFDMLMVFATLVYMAMAGFVPAWFAVIYTAVAGIFVLYFRSKAVTMAFAFPLVALPLIIAYREAPVAAYAFIVWIIIALIFDRHRFAGVVGEFIEGMRRLRS